MYDLGGEASVTLLSLWADITPSNSYLPTRNPASVFVLGSNSSLRRPPLISSLTGLKYEHAALRRLYPLRPDYQNPTV